MDVARQRTQARAQREAVELADWRKPTGDTQQLIIIARGELTCPNCGETFGAVISKGDTAEPFCWRCENA